MKFSPFPWKNRNIYSVFEWYCPNLSTNSLPFGFVYKMPWTNFSLIFDIWKTDDSNIYWINVFSPFIWNVTSNTIQVPMCKSISRCSLCFTDRTPFSSLHSINIDYTTVVRVILLKYETNHVPILKILE